MPQGLNGVRHRRPQQAPPQANGWHAGKIFSSGQRAERRPAAPALPAEASAGRAVERGALLVAAPAGGSTVVLQMPRGNLEAIQPRVLGRAALSALLDVRARPPSRKHHWPQLR